MANNAKIKKMIRRFEKRRKNLYWKKDKEWYLWFQEHEDEIFKEVPGYMGFYFISNYGRVAGFHQPEPRELPPLFESGAVTITLILGGREEKWKVRDLVFLCFRRPLKPGESVVHLNGNPRDNYFKNLGTTPRSKEVPQSAEKSHSGNPPAKSKGFRRPTGVVKFDLLGRFVAEYPSINKAAKSEDNFHNAIAMCVRGKQRHAFGFIWMRRDAPRFDGGITDLPLSTVKAILGIDEILQFGRDGKLLNRYPDCRSAAKAVKVTPASIRCAVRGSVPTIKGYQWHSSLAPRFRGGICDIPPCVAKKNPICREVVKLNRAGKKIAEYPSIRAAADAEGVIRNVMLAFLKGRVPMTSEYYWEYKENHPKDHVPPWLRPPRVLRPNPHTRTVLQFELDGNYIKTFPSITEAARALGVTAGGISKCANKHSASANGFQWFFRSDPRFANGIVSVPAVPPVPFMANSNPQAKEILQFSPDGRYLRSFPNIKAALKTLEIPGDKMNRHLRGMDELVGGFQFRLASDPLFKNGICDIPAVDPG